MVIASRPLIMMLRHILTAEDTPSSLLVTLALKPSALSSGECVRAGAAKQERHLDAVGRDRCHHRTLDVTATCSIDDGRCPLFGAGRGRVEVEEESALLHSGRAGFRDRHGLARSHGGDDEVGSRGEIGVGGSKLDARGARMLAQGTSLIAAKLDVVGQYLHILPAQVLGKNAPDLAIADKAHAPMLRVGRLRAHREKLPLPYCFSIPAFSITARHLPMSDFSRS